MRQTARKLAPIAVAVAMTVVVTALVSSVLMNPRTSDNPDKWIGFRHDSLSVGTILYVSDFYDASEFMEFRSSYYQEAWQGYEFPIENSIFNYWVMERMS